MAPARLVVYRTPQLISAGATAGAFTLGRHRRLGGRLVGQWTNRGGEMPGAGWGEQRAGIFTL
jgi:hypothetical protein